MGSLGHFFVDFHLYAFFLSMQLPDNEAVANGGPPAAKKGKKGAKAAKKANGNSKVLISRSYDSTPGDSLQCNFKIIVLFEI